MKWTTDKLLSVSREYIGTPYHHEARLKGVGIDCVGLVICTHAELGIHLPDAIPYPQYPPAGLLNDCLKKADLQIVPKADARAGDFATFWIHQPGVATHLGVLTDKGLIHCYTQVGSVVEHWMTAKWSKRLVSIRRSKHILPGRTMLQWQL